MFSLTFAHLIFFVHVIEIYFCIVHAEDLKIKNQEQRTVKHVNLIDELDSLYNNAFENEKTNVTRTFFAKDGHTQYALHVQKLREVNGVKTHNLRTENRSSSQEPLIYINNPVEAGIPNPFLGINEFKKIMSERIKNQKKEFDIKIKQHDYKPFKAKHIDNFVREIFDVKMHVKQKDFLRAKTESSTKSSTDKLMKTRETPHKENHKVNKKRKSKVYLSRTTKSTTKPRRKTTTTLSRKTVSDKLVTVTETVANENIASTTTETSIDKKINTLTTADANITTDFVTAEEITTKPTPDGKTARATVAFEDIITTESSAGDETSAATVAVENKTTKSTAGDELTTASVAIEDTTTESTVDEEITTEMVRDEVSAGNITDTTTETTVKTKRTRQARPYVFMGN